MKNQITINGVEVTLTPAKTEPRAGREPFSYHRFDIQQFASGDTQADKDRNVWETVSLIVTPPVFNALLQQSLDRAFQACQKTSNNDTLTPDAKLDAALAYMTEAKFGLSKSTSLSPSDKVMKDFDRTKALLIKAKKDKVITEAQFKTQIGEAILAMQKNLMSL